MPRPALAILTGYGKIHIGKETTFGLCSGGDNESDVQGQVTIPIAIRNKVGLLPNTEVEFVVAGRNVVLRKTPNQRGRGARVISFMRGRATRKMSTDEIMRLTRGE